LHHRQPADRGYETNRQATATNQTMKPVLITNPITGVQSYTKHPERLLERGQIKQTPTGYQSVVSWDIKIVNTKQGRVCDAPRMPVTQWLHA
jgi:hypothetical protein